MAHYMPGGQPVSYPAIYQPVSNGGTGGASGLGLLNELRERLSGAVGGLPTMFRAGAVTARPVPMVMQLNPQTGQPAYWRHVGRPILFSGDLAACRRVERVARRAKRSSRRRS